MLSVRRVKELLYLCALLYNYCILPYFKSTASVLIMLKHKDKYR